VTDFCDTIRLLKLECHHVCVCALYVVFLLRVLFSQSSPFHTCSFFYFSDALIASAALTDGTFMCPTQFTADALSASGVVTYLYLDVSNSRARCSCVRVLMYARASLIRMLRTVLSHPLPSYSGTSRPVHAYPPRCFCVQCIAVIYPFSLLFFYSGTRRPAHSCPRSCCHYSAPFTLLSCRLCSTAANRVS
jgi:hypothetical protein